jgi:hypothetical protein
VEGPHPIHHRKQDLLDLYRKGRLLDPWRSPATRPYRRGFLYALAAAAVLFALAELVPSLAWMVVWAAVILLGATALLAYAVGHTLASRRQVHRWAAQAERNGPAELWLGTEGFRVQQGDAEHVYTWAAIQHAEIHPDHAVVQAHDRRMYTRAAMGDAVYERFVGLLRERVTNGQGSTGG